jgi:alanyl-tRNA synthetase
VTETTPGPADTVLHAGRVVSGEVRLGEDGEAEVNREFREATTRSHTATHVLHHTLRRLLGEHARQAGSLITPGHLRFDFTHFEALPRERLEEIEAIANTHLADDDPVRAYETTIDFARSQGAVALFGEKYGDIVRVVEVGDYSKELCGGTHVHHTGQVALLRVLHEASIGSGFRRIEALTGPDALRHVNAERRLLEEIAHEVGATDPQQAPDRVRRLLAEHKRLQSELGKIQREAASGEVERLAAAAEDVAGVKLVLQRLDGRPEGELRELAPRVASAVGGTDRPAAVVLGTATEKGPRVIASVNKAMLGRVNARELLQDVGPLIRGGVGGKDGLAFAGGSDPAGLDPALAAVRARLAERADGA